MERFVADLQALTATETMDPLRVGEILNLVLDMMASYLPELETDNVDGAGEAAARIVVTSSLYRTLGRYPRQFLIELLTMDEFEHAPERLTALGLLILEDCRQRPDMATLLLEHAIAHILSNIWIYRHTEHRLAGIYMVIAELACRAGRFPLPVLKSGITDELVEYFILAVRDGDVLAVHALRLLVALNYQYIAAEGLEDNKVFLALRSNIPRLRSIGALLIARLNRASDCVEILYAAKLLGLVLTCPDTCDIIYVNDMKVLIDVIIRDLQDVGSEDERMRLTLLQVLHALLANTPIAEHRYKKDILVQLLKDFEREYDGAVIPLSHQCREILCSGSDDSTESSALGAPTLGSLDFLEHGRAGSCNNLKRTLSENNVLVDTSENAYATASLPVQLRHSHAPSYSSKHASSLPTEDNIGRPVGAECGARPVPARMVSEDIVPQLAGRRKPLPPPPRRPLSLRSPRDVPVPPPPRRPAAATLERPHSSLYP